MDWLRVRRLVNIATRAKKIAQLAAAIMPLLSPPISGRATIKNSDKSHHSGGHTHPRHPFAQG